MPAAALHGNLDAEGRDANCAAGAGDGALRLLFVAPERLFQDGFLRWLAAQRLGAFAIDEAHCISQWGHDFRPEYRRLAELRERFPACRSTPSRRPRRRACARTSRAAAACASRSCSSAPSIGRT
jgi:superfamily II DNA helicase RecQ